MIASTRPRPTARTPNAIAPDSAGDLAEADLDIEWSGGIARNATVVFVYAPYSDACSDPPECNTAVVDPVTGNAYGAFDALQRAVQDYTIPASAPAPAAGKVLPVIVMSYGDCEASFSGDSSYQTWVQDLGVQANLQLQTIVVSSGDSGAAGCDEPARTPVQSHAGLSGLPGRVCRRAIGLPQLHRRGRDDAERR